MTTTNRSCGLSYIPSKSCGRRLGKSRFAPVRNVTRSGAGWRSYYGTPQAAAPNRCHAAFELGESQGEKSKKAAEQLSLCDGGRTRVRTWDPMIKRHLSLCFWQTGM